MFQTTNQFYIYISIYNPHCYPFISLVLKTKKKHSCNLLHTKFGAALHDSGLFNLLMGLSTH